MRRSAISERDAVILARLAAGELQRDLAAEFGLTRARISQLAVKERAQATANAMPADAREAYVEAIKVGGLSHYDALAIAMEYVNGPASPLSEAA